MSCYEEEILEYENNDLYINYKILLWNRLIGRTQPFEGCNDGSSPSSTANNGELKIERTFVFDNQK